MIRSIDLTEELVRRLPASIDDPGPYVLSTVPDSYYGEATQTILQNLPADGQLWVFAFGSILWKRRFDVVEERPAAIRGWHRAFCIGLDRRYRGNPAAPGLMLSLDRGGQCRGKVLRMPETGRAATLEDLLRHEPPIPPVWVRAKTPDGEVHAIAFATPRNHSIYYGGLSEAEKADKLASAVGMLGSMAEYLRNTVLHLEAMGIRDAYLWRMQALVAERLARMSGK